MAKAYFAAGCFWGVQKFFDAIDAVEDSYVGYSGGHSANPTYKEVCQGNTGHAEAIEIIFDEHKINYEALVKAFFQCHNPTTKNRQGPDVGTQYRSAIFYINDEQKHIAEMIKKIEQASDQFSGEIVTEITKFSEFYPAEEYHQHYLQKQN